MGVNQDGFRFSRTSCVAACASGRGLGIKEYSARRPQTGAKLLQQVGWKFGVNAAV